MDVLRYLDPCVSQAKMAFGALRAHCYSPGSEVMPSMGRLEPNGMAELVDRMQHAVFSEVLPPTVLIDSAAWKGVGKVKVALNSAALNMIGRERLKARLHLEVLRIVHWCLFMSGADPFHAQVEHRMK